MFKRGWFTGVSQEIYRFRNLWLTVATIIAALIVADAFLLKDLVGPSGQATTRTVTLLTLAQLLAIAAVLMVQRREIRKVLLQSGAIGEAAEEKQLEDAFLDSQSMLRSLIDSLPQNILCKDAQGRFIFGNKTFCTTLGRPLGEILGKTDFDFFPAELAEKYVQDDKAVVESGKTLDVVEEHVTPDGQKMYVRVMKLPRKDYTGSVAGLQAIFWDVTEETLARKERDQERELLHALMDYMEDLIYFKDRDSHFIRANKALAKRYGLSDPSELVGKSDAHFYGGAHSQKFSEDEQKIIRTGQPLIGVEEKEEWADREATWVSTTKMPLRNKQGEIVGVFGISRDITEKKRLEAAMEKSLDALLQVVSSVSEGDLTLRAMEGEDTIGMISGSVNTMLARFGSMLAQVREIAMSVSSCATEILAASEQIAVGSERQANEVMSTSSSVEEMAASMSQVSRNAEAAAEAVRHALTAADLGDQSVRDTTEAMLRMSGAVQQTLEKMRLFAKRSSEISEIIDLIEGISSQTNLLALNAAIEAAHAGSAGLGFSVVAEEIRNLAERSAQATKDIGKLVKAIQSETVEVLATMEGGIKEVETGGALAEQARQALQNISDVVRQSADLIEEISQASDEQANMTRNVAGAMQTISSIAVEASAGAHETTRTIQGMVSLSEHLNEAISRFRIMDDHAPQLQQGSPFSPGAR